MDFFTGRDTFNNALQDIERIYNSGMTWEDKYDAIFNYAPGLREVLDSIGFALDYYDPDTSYEEDVVAYVNALMDMKQRLNAFVNTD